MITLALAFQFAASAATITGTWLTGYKIWQGPAVAVFSQVLWTGVILTGELWGLIPVTAVMFCLNLRNLYLWWPRKNPVPEVF